MTAEDRKRLSGDIAVRYGIRIDQSDPAFVVASLSQHALQEASAELLQQIDTRLKDFEVVVGRTQARAGKYLGAECREQSPLFGVNCTEASLPPEQEQGNWSRKFTASTRGRS